MSRMRARFANSLQSEMWIRSFWPYLSLARQAGMRRTCKAWNHYGTRVLFGSVTTHLTASMAEASVMERDVRRRRLVMSGIWPEPKWRTDHSWSARLARFLAAHCGVCTTPRKHARETTFGPVPDLQLSFLCTDCAKTHLSSVASLISVMNVPPRWLRDMDCVYSASGEAFVWRSQTDPIVHTAIHFHRVQREREQRLHQRRRMAPAVVAVPLLSLVALDDMVTTARERQRFLARKLRLM